LWVPAISAVAIIALIAVAARQSHRTVET